MIKWYYEEMYLNLFKGVISHVKDRGFKFGCF